MRKFTAWSLHLLSVLIFSLLYIAVFLGVIPKGVLAGYLYLLNIAAMPTNLFSQIAAGFGHLLANIF